MKTKVFLLVLAGLAIFVSACGTTPDPKVGTVVQIPEGTIAWQINEEHTDRISYVLREQYGVIVRNTYWEKIDEGGNSIEYVDLSEVGVLYLPNSLSYQTTGGSILIEDADLNRMEQIINSTLRSEAITTLCSSGALGTLEYYQFALDLREAGMSVPQTYYEQYCFPWSPMR